MGLTGKELDRKFATHSILAPALYFRNNVLDILKLAARDEETLQSCRNLVFAAWQRWATELWKRLEERNDSRITGDSADSP